VCPDSQVHPKKNERNTPPQTLDGFSFSKQIVFMKTGWNSRVSTPVPDEHRLAELVNAVRSGDQDAAGEFRHLFYPGTRFLIQRRMGSVDVEQQVAEVLDMAVRTIQEDHSVGGATVTAFVRQSIVERFPTTQKNQGPPSISKDGSVALAKEVLKGLSPVERDALRRCYVLRQSPESFLQALKLTPDQFRAIQSKARTEFAIRHSRQTNVA